MYKRFYFFIAVVFFFSIFVNSHTVFADTVSCTIDSFSPTSANSLSTNMTWSAFSTLGGGFYDIYVDYDGGSSHLVAKLDGTNNWADSGGEGHTFSSYGWHTVDIFAPGRCFSSMDVFLTAPPAPTLGTVCVATFNANGSWTLSGPQGWSGTGSQCRDVTAGAYSISGNGVSGYSGPTYNPGTSQTVSVGGQIGFELTYTFIPKYSCNGSGSCVRDDATGSFTASNCNNTCVPPMSGTLTPGAASCTIASGGSSCNINFSWSTTNPVGTSAVTKPTNITVGSGNSGSNVPFAVKYNSETFYLYNNGQWLAQSTVSSVCTSGTSWNGSSCVLNALVPTGTLTGSPCVITNGNNSCTTTLSWTLANPVAIPTAITASGMANINVTNTLTTPQSGTTTVTVPYSSRTFYLYNNGLPLASYNASAACGSGLDHLNGTSCAPMSVLSCTTPSNDGVGGDAVYNIVVGGITYRVHEFRNTPGGTFVVPSVGVNSVDYLIVGGGAGGGTASSSGYSGGGGGGQVRASALPVAVTPSGSYPITVGAAGAAGVAGVNNGYGGSGGSSSFNGLVSAGGSGGVYTGENGRPGTIGGGGGGNGGVGGVGSVFSGGNGGSNGGGGGGGAGGNGLSGPGFNTGGAGGVGAPSSITGSTIKYGGGGGGGAYTTGGAGVDGGGPGASSGQGTAGVANKGGGGGGSRSGAGGAGGKGVVMVRYQISPIGMCGSLTGPANCTILTGANSCNATLSWGVTNPEVATSQITYSGGTYNLATTFPLPLSQSGTQVVTVPFNSLGVTYNLLNNSKPLAQANIQPLCTSGTSWDPPSQTCKVPVPVITVTVTPPNSTIYTGGSATIAWTSTNAASCTGTNLNTGNATSGSVVVSPLSTTQYTITCNGVSSNTTIIVKKKPSFIEN